MAWEDVTVGYSDMPAELGGTNGRKVMLDIPSEDWGEQLGTGASATRIVGGAFDGSDSVRLVPPTVDEQYSCILRFLDLSNGGAKNVAQVNLGFCIKYGSRYWDLAGQDKLTGIQASDTVGGEPNGSASRAAVFEGYLDGGADDLRRVFCVTATTVASYHQPPSGIFVDTGDDEDKLVILGDTADHENDPPLVDSEWLYFEQEVDYRQDRGNANGRNRLDVWSRDGYLGYLEIPLSWREDGPEGGGDPWDFSNQYARVIEFIGGYWNDHGTANANNYLELSHVVVAVNRAKDARIGPPDEFTGDSSGAPDTTPDSFSFTDQTGVARSSTITSAAITVSGIDAAATISVTGGTYDINGSGSFTSSSGTVEAGDTVRARHTSSASYETATNTVVSIGGVSDTFTSTTEEAPPGEDTTPNAFTFTDQTGVARSTVITSAAITVAGIDAPATISVSGGTYDINGSGTFVSTPGTVEAGDTVRARHTSSASYETATNTVITIGGVSDTFTSTTEEDDTPPPAYRWFRVPRR